ncbi:MAG: DUF389 domain-containing protein, partial [Nocardioides sp.]
MLVHLRLTVPTDLTSDVRRVLADCEHATNVTLLTGASIEPKGDLVEADVAREYAGSLLHDLGETGLP